jgi:ribonuclease BN (tRNA processing enzyme)
VEATPEQALNQLLSPPLFPSTLREFTTPIEVIPIKSETLQVGTLSIKLRRQKHLGGSMGIRIADMMAYVTDTAVEQTTQTFARGVKLLLHEVYLTDAEAERDEVERSRHSYVSGVAQIARRAEVVSLMPIHHHPKRSGAEIHNLAQEMERLAGIEVFVPEEGRVFESD